MKTKNFTNPETSGLFSTYLALLSFGIGTFLLLCHLSSPHDGQIIVLGFFYVVLATLVNTVTLFYLAYQFAIYRFHRELIAIRILILLSNIPIALLYLHIV